MNRKDREITDKYEILRILNQCDTVRLGLTNGNYPYVVPVSFGLDLTAEEPILYIHCAKKGLKTVCIARNRNVCVEADIFYKVESWQAGITARYESVIGFGTVSEVAEEKKYTLSKRYWNIITVPITLWKIAREFRMRRFIKSFCIVLREKEICPRAFENRKRI